MLSRLVIAGNIRHALAANKLGVKPIVRQLNTPKHKSPLISMIRPTSSTTQAAAIRIYPEISAKAQKRVGMWLLSCAGMCYGAVALGGLTRLTESGLSITKWDPVTGVKPPITEEDWVKAFDLYKETPEYKHVHSEITMEDFKYIYYMEWAHRLWGRLVGGVFLLPAVYFWRKGYFAKAMKKRVIIYGALLGVQACLGIFMVNSGLKEKDNPFEVPRVSQYRLAAHLGAALVLYAGFLWSWLNHLLPMNTGYTVTPQIRSLAKYSHGAMTLVFVTALSGAFVAGLDAGLLYNSWPKFADRWIPTDIAALTPLWKNIFENPTTVQFTHRHLGEFTGLATLALWVVARRTPLPPRAMLAANCFGAMALVQVGLGITTLLTFVHTHVAATHQQGSLVLLGFAIWLANELKRIPK